MNSAFRSLFLLSLVLCLAACAARQLPITDRMEGEWVCDATATWQLWNPGKALKNDADFLSLSQSRLRLDFKTNTMALWSERAAEASTVRSAFTIVSRTDNSVTIADGDRFELKDNNTLFVHDPRNYQKGFLFKRK